MKRKDAFITDNTVGGHTAAAREGFSGIVRGGKDAAEALTRLRGIGAIED